VTVAPATTSAPGAERRPRPSPLAVGVVVWLASELMFFAGLFAGYYTLRAAATPDTWPPDDVELDMFRAVLATIVLLSSSLTMHFSVQAAEHGDRRGALRWLYVTFVLGAAFLVNLGFEWASLDFTISTHSYGSIYFLLTGAHGLHLAVGLGLMVAAGMVVSGTDARAPLGPTFTVNAYYWHFVDLVWVFVFTTIFVVR